MILHIRTTALLGTLLFIVGCNRREEQGPNTPPRPPKPGSHPTQATVPATQPIARDITVLQVQRNAIYERIQTFFGRPVTVLDASEWHAIKQHFWTETLDHTIPKPSSGMIGDLLVEVDNGTPTMTQIATGEFTNITDPAEQEFLLAMHLLAMDAARHGGASLPDALADRYADSNITRGDVFMVKLFSDAFVEVIGRQTLSGASMEKWHKLALSPNDLYRLLALRTFRRVEPAPNAWLALYRAFLSEKDHGIFQEASSLVFQTELPEARELLSEFRAGCTEATPPAFREQMEKSIQWLERQHPSSK